MPLFLCESAMTSSGMPSFALHESFAENEF
jgi:hypothetical protein